MQRRRNFISTMLGRYLHEIDPVMQRREALAVSSDEMSETGRSLSAFNDPSGASLNADPVNVRNIYRQQLIGITLGQLLFARSKSGYEPAPLQPQMPGETLLQSFPGFLRREKMDINEG